MKIEDMCFDLSSEQVDEENWDSEKWRKENLMDYFKALLVDLLMILTRLSKLHL